MLALNRLSLDQKIRSLQLLNHCALLLGVALGSWAWWISSFLTSIFLMLVMNIGMHRLFSHRSYETHRWVEFCLAFLSTLTVMGSTIGWVGLHRHHHQFSDQDQDPHSPNRIGAFRAWVGLWTPVSLRPRLVSDLIRDPLHRFIHNNYFKILAFAFLVFLAIDPLAPIFLFCIPATIVLHASSAVNVLCHRNGTRRFETKDESHNNWLASLLSCGEGWHNNHHHNAADYRHGLGSLEFDPPAFIIENFLMARSRIGLPARH